MTRKQTSPFPKEISESGFGDDRLANAFELVWEVQRDNAALPIEPEFGRLLTGIKNADAVLVEARGEMA